MEKTKIGLSVGIVGAAAYLLVLFGGYTPALLLVGYILLCETDTGLKKNAVLAVCIQLAFSLVNTLIGLLPDVIGVFTSLLSIFTLDLSTWIINNIFNFFYNVLGLAKTLVLLVMAFLAYKGKTFELPFLNKLFD